VSPEELGVDVGIYVGVYVGLDVGSRSLLSQEQTLAWTSVSLMASMLGLMLERSSVSLQELCVGLYVCVVGGIDVGVEVGRLVGVDKSAWRACWHFCRHRVGFKVGTLVGVVSES